MNLRQIDLHNYEGAAHWMQPQYLRSTAVSILPAPLQMHLLQHSKQQFTTRRLMTQTRAWWMKHVQWMEWYVGELEYRAQH